MATTQKALELAAYIAEEFGIRYAGKTITQSFDTDGCPLVAMNDGTPATTEQNILLKVKPIDWPLAKDVLGNTATNFGPHVIQIALEATAASATVVRLTAANMLALLGCVALKGTKVEIYGAATGSAPVAANFTTTVAGNNLGLLGSFEGSLQYPMVQSQ